MLMKNVEWKNVAQWLGEHLRALKSLAEFSGTEFDETHGVKWSWIR